MKKVMKLELSDEVKILNDQELKMITGGDGGEFIGARCSEGECYCDFHMTDGDYTYCDVPCDMNFCHSMGIWC